MARKRNTSSGGALGVGVLVLVVAGLLLGLVAAFDAESSNRWPVDPVDVGDDIDLGGGSDLCTLSIGDGCGDDDSSSGGGSGSSGDDVIVGDASGVGDFEALYWETFVDNFVQPDGRVLSQLPGFACGNGGIGCGSQTTSEGVSRTAWYAAHVDDKEVFDRMIGYIAVCMQHPEADYLMWNRDEDCNSAGGGGSNSANDADLIMIDALKAAIKDRGWTSSGSVDLDSLKREIAAALKPAVVDGFVTHCTTYFSDRDTNPAVACEPRGFPGYIELHVLKAMSLEDNFWASVYDENKRVQIQAVQTGNGGVWDTYYPEEGRFASERDSIERLWIIRNLVEDGSQDAWLAAKPIYELARDDFLTKRADGKEEICKNLAPGTGCVFEIPEQVIYGFWLDAASARVDFGNDPLDEEFRDELVSVIKPKVRYAGPVPMLVDDWQYSQTVLLEALREAELSGGSVGGTIA